MPKIEQKFNVQPNSQIKEIYEQLNSVQKQTVFLFDKDKDGILDLYEAEAFNQTIFSEKKGSIDCWSSKGTKKTVSKKNIDMSFIGKSEKKGNVTKYYDSKNNLYGITEKCKDGRIKYSDKDGNCLYYKKPTLLKGTTYYDKTGTPIYRTRKSQCFGGEITLEYFDKTGKVYRREECVVDMAPTASYQEAFTELWGEPHRRPGEAVFCPH